MSAYFIKDTHYDLDRFYVETAGSRIVVGTRATATAMSLDLAKAVLRQLHEMGRREFQIFPADQFPRRSRR